MIKQYFTFPKVVMTLTVFLGYFCFELFDDPKILNLLSISVVAFSINFSNYIFVYKFRKNKWNVFLKYQILTQIYSLSFATLNITLMP